MPMTAILHRPDSIGPSKFVCFLMRFSTMIPSARAAQASRYTGKPAAVVPSGTTSMVARIGQPMVASVMPSAASTPR